MSHATEFLLYALSIGALELVPEGRILKSGRVSPYFFNSGLFNTGASISKLATAYASAIAGNLYPEAIFGHAYKGIPIATAVAQAIGGDMGYAFNRKEVKDHGEGGIIVGASLQGRKVVIVDDVMTTGTSSGEAFNIVKSAGGIPIGCVIAFDRQERGKGSRSAVQEFQDTYKIPVYAAATLSDLTMLMQEDADSGRWPLALLLKILDYKLAYGV